MSRLLDVRFAQRQTGENDSPEPVGDFSHWVMLLRSCGGHHAYRRLVSGPLQPENVARFLIFENSFARSLSHSIGEIEQAIAELRTVCGVQTPTPLLKRLSDLRDMLHFAQGDPGLIPYLHTFNDAMQRELIALTDDLAACYFKFEVDVSSGPIPVSPPAEHEEPEWVQPVDDEKTAVGDTDPNGHSSQSQSQS